MSNLLYLGFFAVFVAIAAAVRLVSDPKKHRRAVTALIVYVLSIYTLLIITRRDAWPFVTHGVFLEEADEHRAFWIPQFVGVDRLGREYRIDASAWEPLNDRTLAVWWVVHFDRLPDEVRRNVLAFLLHRAERDRATPGHGLLDRLRLPSWYSIELPPAKPSDSFVAIRVYLVTRVAAEKLATGVESTRLLAEFHE